MFSTRAASQHTLGSVPYQAAHSSRSDSMSTARTQAIEKLREGLVLNVLLTNGLHNKINKAAGGFMTRPEVQQVTSKGSNMEQMSALLDILLEKGDAAFDNFVKLLGDANYEAWGSELAKAAKQFGEELAQSPAAQQQGQAPVTGSSTTDARVQQLASEVQRLQVDLEVTRSQLHHYIGEVEIRESEIARQDQVIAMLSATAESTTREKDATIAQLQQTIAQLQQTLAQQQAQGGAFQQQSATNPAAGSSDAEAASAGVARLEKARALFQVLQNNPHFDNEKLTGVITCFMYELTNDQQLCEQVDSLTNWVVGRGGFINGPTQRNWQCLSSTDKVSKLFDTFKGHSRWSDSALIQKYAIDAWMLLLRGLNEHGCSSAADILLRGFENVSQGREAYQDA
ncbi:MAG: hypothetical protein OXC07_09015 [Kistimonas sp.]|nr:hypothetical protein [Kistimonas sp.]